MIFWAYSCVFITLHSNAKSKITEFSVHLYSIIINTVQIIHALKKKCARRRRTKKRKKKREKKSRRRRTKEVEEEKQPPTDPIKLKKKKIGRLQAV
jgi:hypothetical protein